jgi:hypothetical protein
MRARAHRITQHAPRKQQDDLLVLLLLLHHILLLLLLLLLLFPRHRRRRREQLLRIRGEARMHRKLTGPRAECGAAHEGLLVLLA